jgi:hypothetical protein
MNPAQPTCEREATTCADVEPLLPIIADGGLDPSTDVEIFAHLARCQDCQDALARHDLVTLAIANGAEAPPQSSRLELVHLRLPLPYAIASAAAAVFALAGAWWLTQAAQQPSAPQSAMLAQKLLPKNASEIIRVTKPGQPNGQPYYLVVQDGSVMLIDPQAVDGVVQPHTEQAVPVSLHRY